jgi:membrane-associated phospholipid phosphatase
MRTRTRTDTPVARRWRLDLAVIAVSLAVLALCVALASGPLTDVEETLFRQANGLPESLFPLIWPLMQYGTFITIPLLALVAFAFRRWRLGVAMLVAGVGVYLVARVLKEVVSRGRPGGLLADVNSHESFATGSLGFPSGHAAVSAALTAVAFAFLPRRVALIALVVAVIVMFGRMYVGAHLPLDLVGGAALGAIAGSLANLLVGVPSSDAPAAPADQDLRLFAP